jgi:NAD-dependent SIR2 family protein deacetylase
MLKPDIVYFGDSVAKDVVEQAYSLVDEATRCWSRARR